MGKTAEILIDITNMEKFADNDTFIHTLDPRCKIILTLFFTISVISFNRYETVALLPFLSFPLFLTISAEIPLSYLIKKIAVVSIFALCVAIANPLMDTQTAITAGSINISNGWLSFTSIMLRFFLTAATALLLLITTGMYNITKGMEKLGVPHIFTMQLFFLSRYIFSLTEEVTKMERARAARSFGKKGVTFKVFTNILSSLFIRSIERAEHVYTAMKCRGFEGSIKTVKKIRWKLTDTLFLTIWTMLFIIFRLYWYR